MRHILCRVILVAGGKDHLHDPVTMYLFDINAFKIGRLPSALYHDKDTFDSLGRDHPEYLPLLEAMKIYDNGTQVRLPDSWSSLEAIPTVSTQYDDIRQCLFHQIVEYKQSPHAHPVPTDDRFTSIITKKLSTILAIATTAAGLKDIASGQDPESDVGSSGQAGSDITQASKNPAEAIFRIVFDKLLGDILEDRPQGIHVKKECDISMPRNDFYDSVLKEPNFIIGSMYPITSEIFPHRLRLNFQEMTIAGGLEAKFPSLAEEGSRTLTVALAADRARVSNQAHWESIQDAQLCKARALCTPRKGTSDSTSILQVQLPNSNAIGVTERLEKFSVVKVPCAPKDDAAPKKKKNNPNNTTRHNTFLRRDVDLNKPSDILGIGVHEYTPVKHLLPIPQVSLQAGVVVGPDATLPLRHAEGESSAAHSDVDSLSSVLDKMTLDAKKQNQTHPSQSNTSDKNLNREGTTKDPRQKAKSSISKKETKAKHRAS
ncbi:hypothetical protein OF83DRAFT_889469 [Amylostereum chailletii]|nr:hypothetical protein OF83DRAFT_889469 [Amylostereum chailletii]